MTMSRADEKENQDIFLDLWLQRGAWNDSIAYECKPYVRISIQSTFARGILNLIFRRAGFGTVIQFFTDLTSKIIL